MKGKAGPNSKKLLTVADAEKFLSSSEHSIVGKPAAFHFVIFCCWLRYADVDIWTWTCFSVLNCLIFTFEAGTVIGRASVSVEQIGS